MRTPEELEKRRQQFALFELTYGHQLESFAVQLGCSSQEAVKATERVFRHLHYEWSKFKRDELKVQDAFQWMIREIETTELTTNPITWLHFEEDRNFFHHLLQLPFEERVIFAFYYFHHLSIEEIARLLEKSTQSIDEMLTMAKQSLPFDQVDKRIALLHKSFSRYPHAYESFQLKEDNVQLDTTIVEEEVHVVSKRVVAFPAKTIIVWSTAFVVLLGISFITYFTSDEFQQVAVEKYINSLRQQFEEEINEKMILLGIASSINDQHVFFEVDMIGRSREEFDLLMRDIERQQRNGEKIDKNYIEERYDHIRERLLLPSELITLLLRNPKRDDYEESIQFLEQYFQKQNDLGYLYHMEIAQFENTLQPLLRNETEKTLTKETMATLPEELQLLIRAMEEQFITLVRFPGERFWFPQYDYEKALKTLQPLLHEDTHVYLALFDSSIYLLEDPTTSSGDYVAEVDRLFQLEKELLKQQGSSFLGNGLQSHYIGLIYLILGKGYEMNIYSDEGIVKEGVKRTWLRVMEGEPTSPIVQVLQPIVEEMEMSNWRSSTAYDWLDDEYLHQVLMAAIDGRPIPAVITEIVQEEEQVQVISLDDQQYWGKVEKLYTAFQGQYDYLQLIDVSPLYILGIVLLAERQNDLQTIWHLVNPEQKSVNYETFQLEWKRKLDRYDGKEKISIGVQNTLNGQPLVPILIEEGGNETYWAWLILHEETNCWMLDVFVK